MYRVPAKSGKVWISIEKVLSFSSLEKSGKNFFGLLV